jgi:hypothetical protein
VKLIVREVDSGERTETGEVPWEIFNAVILDKEYCEHLEVFE